MQPSLFVVAVERAGSSFGEDRLSMRRNRTAEAADSAGKVETGRKAFASGNGLFRVRAEQFRPAIAIFAPDMLGLFYILFFWLVGNGIARFTGIPLSGNVIGMVLLFCALATGAVRPRSVRPAAKFLLGSMALFFVPFGVGLMVSYEILLRHLWAIVAAAVVSTLLVLVAVGWCYQLLERKR